MTRQTISCATCVFFKRRGPGLWEGYCLRFPPTKTSPDHSGFPSTHEDLWCGEWKEAEDEDEDPTE